MLFHASRIASLVFAPHGERERERRGAVLVALNATLQWSEYLAIRWRPGVYAIEMGATRVSVSRRIDTVLHLVDISLHRWVLR